MFLNVSFFVSLNSFRPIKINRKWIDLFIIWNTNNKNLIIIIIIIIILAGGSMRSYHAAGPIRFPVGTIFMGEFFSGVFFTCKTNVWKLWALKVSEYHLGVIIILSYSPCSNEWVHDGVYYLPCSCCFVVAPALSWALIRGIPPCPWVVKKVCMWFIINSLSRQVVAL